MNRWDIVNRFIKPESAYLEIGVDEAETWDKIECWKKVGVDPVSQHATHKMTSDQFFLNCEWTKFNVVFIDGLHIEGQVDRDVKNARKFLAPGGTIVMHDCIPRVMEHATEIRIDPEWYGTVWRSAVKLAFHPGVDFSVVDADAGCGILKEGSQPIPEGVSLPESLDPDFFHKNYQKIYRIVP